MGIVQFAMGVVKPGTIRSEGKPRAEAFRKAIRKHGIPLDVDVVFDCRFLPNPFWVEELRPFSGEDEPVRDYVLGQPESQDFLQKVDELMTSILPAFTREGKSYLTIAMGCTGGRHRSVTLARELATRLSAHGEPVSVFHRDIDR